jgi:hypothetical protein
MNMKILRTVFSFALVSLVFLQGCSANKPYVRKDAALAPSLKCIRYETPGIQRKTMAETLILTSAVIAIPGGSALLLVSDEYSKSRGGKMQEVIPDFVALVIDRFGEKISAQTPVLPPLAIVDQPVKGDYVETCNLLEFKVKKLAYGYLGPIDGSGFLSDTIVTMKDASGEVLWQKDFTYLSKDFNRGNELEQYEADDAKLLKEEFIFAADMTANDFYQDLQGANSDKKSEP